MCPAPRHACTTRGLTDGAAIWGNIAALALATVAVTVFAVVLPVRLLVS